MVVSGLRPSELAGMSDRSDREYFRIHLDGSTTDAHIGHPMRGRRTGVEVIPVSYPVRQSDGRLMGVLLALIDVEALERIWVDIGFKPEDRIELIGQDNKVWFSWSGAAAGPAVAGKQVVVAHHRRAGRCGWSPPSTRPRSIARAADRGGR